LLSAVVVALCVVLGGCAARNPAPAAGAPSSTPTSTAAPIVVPSAGMPPGFPADVPVVSGEVPAGARVADGWTVVIKVTDMQASFTEASTKLKDAGFEVLAETVGASGSFGAYRNKSYQVQVTSGTSPEYGVVTSYVVTPLR